MSDAGEMGLDLEAMLERFRRRASAVRNRSLPPVGGDERKAFLEQKQLDFLDFAMLADAEASIEDGIVTLRIDLRPPAASDEDAKS